MHVYNSCIQPIQKFIITYTCPCRRKPRVAEDVSDRELFDRLPLNDTWCDAKLFEVFNYLWQSKSTCIPESWFCTMYEFHEEFRGAVVGDPDLVAEYSFARAGHT